MAAPVIYWGSSGRHAPLTNHHHWGFSAAGGWLIPFASGRTFFRSNGTADGAFVGGKFYDRASGSYQRVTRAVLHFRAAFGTPPADGLELCAVHAMDPDNRRGEGARTQCWLRLNADGHLEALAGWTTATPASGTSLGVSTATVTTNADVSTSSPIFTEEDHAALRRYMVLFDIHPTAGKVWVWAETGFDTRKMQLLWQLDDVNTQGDGSLEDCFAWSIGQRSPSVVVPVAASGRNPFPGSAAYAARYEDLVVADQALGGLRLHTCFTRANGTLNEFDLVDPLGGTVGSGHDGERWYAVNDDPLTAFGPDEDFTEVAQDGSLQGETERFLFDPIPALETDEAVIGVGLALYQAGSEDNSTTYGLQAQDRSQLYSPDADLGDEFLEGPALNLYDKFDPAWVSGSPSFGGAPYPDGDSFLGANGFVYRQDWWTQRAGAFWTRDQVNAVEGGVTTVLRAVELSQVTLLVITAAPPCEGDPTNPYPHEPPPQTPPPTAAIAVMRQGVWVPLDPYGTTAGEGLSGVRQALASLPTDLRVMHQGQWVQVAAGSDEPTTEPPDVLYPPFFDPCNLLAEVPPGDVEVLPLTGRFYGPSSTPPSVCGPLFTGTVQPLGWWTANDLTTLAAKSGTLVGAQGGYKKFMPSGVWSRDDFVAITYANLRPLLTLLQDATGTGVFFGYHIIDDFASPNLWPPSGVPEADLVWALGQLRTLLPDIRLGIRGRPRQFSANLGFDFYHAQFVSWRGETATQFATAEYTLAVAWNAYALLNLNYLHGGDGSSGIRHTNGTTLGQSAHNYECSPAEVAGYLSDMFNAALAVDGTAAKLAGSVGYQYDETMLARAGMIDAHATARNALASLPALP